LELELPRLLAFFKSEAKKKFTLPFNLCKKWVLQLKACFHMGMARPLSYLKENESSRHLSALYTGYLEITL
jgi:hypothetical protein